MVPSKLDAIPGVLQIAHGKIMPYYSSAYSLRCHSVIKSMNRRIISCAGPVFRDEISGYAEQYRSLLTTGLSFIKGNRSLEIYISRGKYLRKRYLKRLRKLVSDSEIVIFEGPWQFSLVKNQLRDKFVVYDAHNVEYLLRIENKYKNECKDIEGDLLSRSDIVLSVTKKDIQSFQDIYNVDRDKLFYAPHLVDPTSIPWKGSNSNRVLFIGSIYSPNNSALDLIYEIAKKLPQFKFEIIGSVRSIKKKKPVNVFLHGIVDETVKDQIMSGCFLALNPVTEGSGRNVKMIDYLAHGLPILSTPVGTRGLEGFDLSGSVVVSCPSQFSENINRLSANREDLKKMSANARELYENILKSEGSIDPEEIILKKYETRNVMT